LADDNTTQCWLFEGLAKRPVTVRFDQERDSSDGGAVLLGAADRRLGLSDALANGIRDSRDAERVVHEISHLVRQRVYGIACGCPDGNDAARPRLRVAFPKARFLVRLDAGFAAPEVFPRRAGRQPSLG
jgi:hypothetical protein